MRRSAQKNNRPASSKGTCATLTPRQVQILRLIHAYRLNNGCSPTLRELARQLQLSRVTVFEHVEALVQRGLLQRRPNRARSLTIDFSVVPDGLLSDDDGESTSSGTCGSLRCCYPLLGRIAAGVPLEALENPDTLDIGGMFETTAGTFVLQVAGESMINEQIRHGDYVLVERSQTARDGQIVVAMLENGETTLKKLYRQGQGFRLEGANPEFTPIYTDQLSIQGVVIGVIRQY